MPKRNVVRGEGETRQRILDAAIRSFAEASYDEVSLREIATDVGVDVAYVHRSFGSKEQLFQEALDVAGADSGVSEDARDELVKSLTDKLFDRPHSTTSHGVEPLLLLIRSLTSQKAGQLSGAQIEREFIEPIRTKLGDANGFRSTVIMSLLIGLSIMRNLLELPGATETDVEQARAFVATVLQGIIDLKTGQGEA
ncbi:TetR/AcrR family transcriptional regulator [Agrobacterium sp. OT33]|uniref:TetR/AcrR family transcriptional regulator n=1 Tax=Agrobacterium sp. OT33 TaxID=2815338 RepID=UPI001A8C632C|nr:TetR/AcrR family transcriptional regulator [Agrobacterium sp. OT33]MBO0128464.1 TetR/AcrR family transcriptional regulator [Agrobacterium sp. OT33]